LLGVVRALHVDVGPDPLKKPFGGWLVEDHDKIDRLERRY
jgi:hypothetical protein